MNDKKKYWFPAKQYGWGWGLPCSWQGWLIFVGYLVAIISASVFFNPANKPTLFYLIVFGASILMIIICFFKGEPAKWRWGKSEDKK